MRADEYCGAAKNVNTSRIPGQDGQALVNTAMGEATVSTKELRSQLNVSASLFLQAHV
jgi:hypothetical protein